MKFGGSMLMTRPRFVYLAQHNPCIFESEFQTLSVHAREVTAEQALLGDRRRRYKHRLPQQVAQADEYQLLQQGFLP